MASGEQVPKQLLIDEIRRTVSDGASGFFTILTDQKRSIMFRFSEGKLIHSHCRSRNVDDAIEALNECEALKFTHATAQPKDQPELMAAQNFLQAIAIDANDTVNQPFLDAIDRVPESRQLVEKVETSLASALETPINSELKGEFSTIAGEYIGRVADVLVPNVFAKQLSTEATIAEIAAAIPVAEYANEFRQRVGELATASDEGGDDVKTEPDHRLFF